MNTRLTAALGAVVSIGLAGQAHAGLGDQVFVVDPGADVVVTFEGNFGAGFTNLLFVQHPSRSVFDIFNNQTTPVGTQVNLGTFSLGELMFGINVHPSGLPSIPESTWFSGPASRNSDNIIHANVADLGGDVLRIGFEDLSSPDNYTDLVFTVTNALAVPIPEPKTWATLLAGLGLLGIAALRRRQAIPNITRP